MPQVSKNSAHPRALTVDDLHKGLDIIWFNPLDGSKVELRVSDKPKFGKVVTDAGTLSDHEIWHCTFTGILNGRRRRTVYALSELGITPDSDGIWDEYYYSVRKADESSLPPARMSRREALERMFPWNHDVPIEWSSDL